MKGGLVPAFLVSERTYLEKTWSISEGRVPGGPARETAQIANVDRAFEEKTGRKKRDRQGRQGRQRTLAGGTKVGR